MLTLSELASRKLNELISAQVATDSAQESPRIYALRVHAMSGCCSGPSYGLSFARESMPGDWEGEFGGVRLLVDPDSAPMLEGAVIDYIETPEASGFTIQNPNAAGAQAGCGCGHGHAEAHEAAHAHAEAETSGSGY